MLHIFYPKLQVPKVLHLVFAVSVRFGSLDIETKNIKKNLHFT